MSSYQTALTIAEIMNGIEGKKYLLPSIQREFVWDQRQIETLFDSLMRDYPINSFLFWEVPESKMDQFRFYEFLKDYHQKDHRHNPVADTRGFHGLTAILDGQQRMTSLYFEEWMDKNYSDPMKRKNYMELHCIPDVDFSFRNFREFYEKREALVFDRLKKVLLNEKPL